MAAIHRKTLPRIWLFTDERVDTVALVAAARRLPRRSGIVFRHHATGRAARRALFDRIRRIAKARGHVLMLAGDPRDAVGWKADGWHGPAAARRRLPQSKLRSCPVHDRMQGVAARRAGADLLFVSPVFATRSHPGGRTLGPAGFVMLARRAGRPAIALGGMNARRFAFLRRLGAHGWAALDGLIVAGAGRGAGTG